jgi:oligopeptide transport system ATP-binding protein
MTAAGEPLLEIEGLCTDYAAWRGLLRRGRGVRILEDFDLTVRRGETLGLVGESGCGKTTLLLSLLRLVPSRAGRVLLDSEDVLAAGGEALRRIRREAQVVFQNPYSSLDPRMTVLELVAEPLRVHGVGDRAERRAAVLELLDAVGLSEQHLGSRSRQLSGGQAQRVAIARAIALRPKLLVLDEPTSALDVSVQAQVLNLLLELQSEFGMTYLFVSHDLRVVQHVSDRIAVMYLGEIVETGNAEEVFAAPAHPYTQTLLAAGLSDKAPLRDVRVRGGVPRFTDPPSGCRFHPRCPHAMDICRTVSPDASTVGPGHWGRCHLIDPNHKETAGWPIQQPMRT